MAVSRSLYSLRGYLAINLGTTSSGAMKTGNLNVGDLATTGYQTTGYTDDKFMAVCEKLAVCLARSVVACRVQETHTVVSGS